MSELKLFTQKEAAEILGYNNYKSLNRLIYGGKLNCLKREGRNGRKLFTQKHLDEFIKNLKKQNFEK